MTASSDTPMAASMAESIRILLRTFIIDEKRFPAAMGQMRHNAADFQTLHFIAANPGCKSAELAAFLGVAPTTAQSVLERLIKRDLISRGPHATSNRAVALSITAKGAQMRQAINAQDQANCAAMLNILPAKARADFVVQLGQIAEAVNKAGARQ
jgi:DNA-binding MarR family transcriptional regulator